MATLHEDMAQSLKTYANGFWSTTETGDSKWSGEYPRRYYHYGVMFDYRVKYYVNHTCGSNAGFKWTTIPMKDCFRVDLFFLMNEPFNWAPWVKAETKLKKKPKRMDEDWFYELKIANRSPNYEAHPFQNITPFLCYNFGWMYRSYLNYFFLLNSIGQYDTVKGIKVTWVVPKDDEVWKHPDDGKEEETEKPIDEKPIDEKPIDEKPIDEKPIDEKPIDEKPIDEKPIEEKPIDEKPIEEKPIEEKPIEVVDPVDPTSTANSLIPFITTIEIEITKVIDELKKCLEQKRKLQEKKSKLCKDYNKALEDTLKASNKKYEILINSAKRQKDEELACLTVLCESFGSKEKPEVSLQDKDAEIKKKIEAVKGKCKVVFG